MCAVVIQLRRGLAKDWTDTNPQLAQGEAGIELDTWKWKIGDGKLRWIELPYMGDVGADEIHIGPSAPAAAGKFEFWIDTNTTPPTLKGFIGGQWVPIGPAPGGVIPSYKYDAAAQPGINPTFSRSDHTHGTPPEEVAVGNTAPTGSQDLWVDTSTTPAVLKAKVGGVWTPVTAPGTDAPDEVHVGPSPPRDVTTELWYDTSTTPGVLKAHLPDGSWEVTSAAPSGPGIDEVWVGANPPDPVGTYELWYDLDDQVLKVKLPTGEWAPITTANGSAPAPDEVHVGPTPPRDRQTELWYDTTLAPGVLNVRIEDGSWEQVTSAGSEVHIGPDDPYVADPAATDELWLNPVDGQFFARLGDSWVGAIPIAPDEVWTGPEDPSSFNPAAQLWFDTDEPVPSAAVEAPDEVLVSPAQPRDIHTELWVDTTTDPAVLKANVDGAWKEVGETTSEVVISDTDPYLADANATDELWFDTSATPASSPSAPQLDWTYVTYTSSGTPDPPTGETRFAVDNQQADLTTTVMFAARSNSFDYSDGIEQIAVGHILRAQTAVMGEWWKFTVTSPPVRTEATMPYYTLGITQESSSGTQPVFPTSQYVFWTFPDPADLDATHPAGTAVGGALKARVGDAWQDVFANATITVPDEVHVGPAPPRDQTVELWVDTTDTPAVLKAREPGGDWLPVGSDAQPGEIPPNEVMVGPTDPATFNPACELWFDTTTDPGVLRARVPTGTTPSHEWQDVASGGTPGPIPPNEVFVGPVAPTPDVELWYDTSTTPGALKVAVPTGTTPSHAWQVVGGADEVLIQPEDPLIADPASPIELWYDTDDPGAPGGTFGVPDGGTTDQVLTKVTDADGDTDWRDISEVPDGGSTGKPLIKASDADGDTQWGGTIQMPNDAKVQFPNQADVAKINLYADTFGLGIESGTTTIFGSSHIRFRVGTPADPARGGITSPEVGSFDSGGVISAGKRVMVAREFNGIVLVAGQWYNISFCAPNSSAAGACRFTFAARGGGLTHIVSGQGLMHSSGLGGMTVFGNNSAGGKIFNRVQVTAVSNNYYVCARAQAAVTVDCSIEAMDMVDGNPSAQAMNQVSITHDYAGVDL